MAQIGNFDATTVEPAGDFSPIPAGEYLSRIVDSDMKPTKSGNGEYLELKFEIIDGQYKGRFVWSRLNIVNPNQQAKEIANRQLSAICHAVNKIRITDSQELHYKPLIIRVELIPADGVNRKSDSNDIKAYKAASETPAAANQLPPQASSPAGAPAWMNRPAA